MGRVPEVILLPDKFSSPLDENLAERVEKKKVKAANIGNKNCKDCYGRGYVKRNFGEPINFFEYCGKCVRKHRNKKKKNKGESVRG